MSFLNLDNKINKLFKTFNGQNIKKELEAVDKSKKKIIGFYGLQGGVGVSSLMYQIALNINKSVLIFDSKLLNPYHYIYIANKNQSSFQDYIFNELATKKEVKAVDIYNIISKKGKVNFVNVPPTSMTDYLTITQNKKSFTATTSLVHDLSQKFEAVFIDIDVNNIDNFISQGLLNQIDCFIEVSIPSLSCDLNRNVYAKLLNKNELRKLEIVNRYPIEITDFDNLPYEDAFSSNESYGDNYLKNEKCSDRYKEIFRKKVIEIENLIDGK